MRRCVSAMALALGFALPHAARAEGRTCEGLLELKLPHAKVTAAAVLPQFPPQGASEGGPPPVKIPFCRVEMTATPTADSDIKIELWIPEGAAWNGRYLQVGNGGFAGHMPYGSLMAGLRKGYATAGTDDGHEAPKDDDATYAAFALGHPEKVTDFGWRALKETTDLSKTVLGAYRGAPKYAYFNGCSDGGREALMEAQRFPADFDGVVAGDPANDWTHLQAAGVIGQQRLLGRAENFLPIAKLGALEAAAKATCADEEGVIENPLACRFDPRRLICKGPETDACLTPAQAETAQRFYQGTRDGHGRLIMPGLDPGGEGEKNGWGRWIIGEAKDGGQPSFDYNFNHNFFADVVYGKESYDIMSFNYDRDMPAVESKFAPIFDSNDPNLSAFKARGGKLIQYHGWADPAIPARDSIVYFQAVQRTLGPTGDFYRLFMAPGMLHCAGGPGPSAFDMQAVISKWVEAGEAPQRVVATKYAGDDMKNGVAFTRPLCPYPAVAQFSGTGERAQAASWVCRAP